MRSTRRHCCSSCGGAVAPVWAWGCDQGPHHFSLQPSLGASYEEHAASTRTHTHVHIRTPLLHSPRNTLCLFEAHSL